MGAINRDLRETHSIGPNTREWLLPPSACPALVDHGIMLCGVSEARPGFHFVRNAWGMTQVLATCRGHGRALVEREWRQLSVGNAYLTPPGSMHAYQADDEREPWVVAWVMWHAEVECSHPKAPAIVAAPDALALRHAILDCHREIHGAADAALSVAYAALIDRLGRRIAGPDSEPSLRPLWEAVSHRPAEAWSLSALARLAGLAEEQLRRRCQRETGTSPMRRVAELRLRHAAALLSSTELPIADIAERVGYHDAFAFSTAFKRLHGHSPITVRKPRRP